MKTILKLVCAFSLLGLAACSVSGGSDVIPFFGGIADLEKISSAPLSGTMGGNTWTISKAIGVVQPDGMLQVSIAGNGEKIDCNYKIPNKPGLLFTVPMKVANYEFDMLREGGYAVTWVYSDSQSRFQNVFSDKNSISITSVTADRMQGGLSAKFFDPSYSGSVSGTFEVTICR